MVEKKAPKNSTRARAKRGGPRSNNGVPNGPGWGGPAKGAGKAKPNDPSKLIAGPHPPSEAGEARRAHQSQWAQKAKEIIYDIMTNKEAFIGTRLQAAQAMLNRIEGMPIARTLGATVGDPSQLSDQELLEELAKLARPDDGAPDGETIQ